MPQPSDGNREIETLPYGSSKPRRKVSWLISGGVLMGLLIAFLARGLFERSNPSAPVIPPTATGPSVVELRDLQAKVERQQHWQIKVEPRLAVANQATTEAIEKSLEVLTEFVAVRKAGARPFAEAMLTLRSKWQMVKAHLPGWLGGDDNAHKQFLDEQFSKSVFSSEDMKRTVEATVQTYVNHVQAIENKLLVDIRADLADIPIDQLPALKTDEAFRKEYNRLFAEVAPEIEKSLGLDVTREITSWFGGNLAARVAVRVLGAVATRLGISAGILAAGGEASWATFGLSIVAAIVVDYVVGWVIDKATDPVGKIEQRVKEMLDEITKQIIDGEGNVLGLRRELSKLDSARAQVRNNALRKLILGG